MKMDLKNILKKAFDAGYDTSVMYNCGDGNAYEDFESFYRNEIKQLTLTDVGCSLPTKDEMDLTVMRTVKNMRDNDFTEDDILMWSTGYKLGFINAQIPKK